MSNPYTKELTFRSNNLRKFATLVLIFDQQVDGLFVTKFPVVWRSSEFQSDGASQVSVTYHNQPAFLKPGPLVNNVIVDIAASQVLDPAQQTTLLVDEVGRFSFTNPETLAGQTGNVTVVNGTTASAGESVAFGFGQLDPNQTPTPVYYWNPGDFKPSSSIGTKLNPVLRAYITDQYDDAQVIRGPLSNPIFEKDISTLAKSTTWILTYNAATGKFEIKPELA